MFCDYSGSGQSHGAAGTGGEDKGENIRQAEDLFCRSGLCVYLHSSFILAKLTYAQTAMLMMSWGAD